MIPSFAGRSDAPPGTWALASSPHGQPVHLPRGPGTALESHPVKERVLTACRSVHSILHRELCIEKLSFTC